ncbi:MAG TPA: hypothetical protein VN649_16315 [Ramlibacter sp.]|nr:hypothetical protein [Ramlibacter sp.]
MNMAETLNLECLCSTLQPELLRAELDAHPGLRGMAQKLAIDQPHLFSNSPVFISAGDFEILARSVSVLHRTGDLPAYQACALQRSAPIASMRWGPQGVFMGYDFHMGADGPRLIEINTNAGGAFLHAAAARAHRSCCEAMHRMFHAPAALDRLDEVFLSMFRAEWLAQRGDAPLRTIAIVDDEPANQYLAPEFELARALFAGHGIAAVIADPRELEWRSGALWHPLLPEGLPVDLIYNRLTDFDLSLPAHAALRSAYDSGAAVVTPDPRAHALHADKRNLVALSDDALLASWGVAGQDRALLRTVVPRTQLVTADNAEALWAQRRRLFFKPAAGYGSKGAYRGDKLTRRVWTQIVAGNFIAQDFVAPSERLVNIGGLPTRLKLDVRAYAYAGQIQLLAARTYAGQTTNFRTAGGGFSPVVIIPDTPSAAVVSQP